MLSESERLALSQKFTVFQSLVAEFPVSIGKEASRKERDEREDLVAPDATLTYGEIDFISLGEVFESIKSRYGGIPSGGIFYDLGSGTGKGVVAAALLHSFAVCRGIEILEGLYSISRSLREKYDSAFPQAAAASPELWPSVPVLEFFKDDLFAADWTDASFVFANSTCFDLDMMRRIGEVPVRPGTLGVSFTKNFPSASWVTLENIKKNMSWGEATVYIQRKVE